jgi:chromate transport protein ChrA
MGKNHGVAAAVLAFLDALYVLLVSYFTLLRVFANLLDVLACLHVVKLSSAYVLLTLVIKLTRKLLNILTGRKGRGRG